MCPIEQLLNKIMTYFICDGFFEELFLPVIFGPLPISIKGSHIMLERFKIKRALAQGSSQKKSRHSFSALDRHKIETGLP